MITYDNVTIRNVKWEREFKNKRIMITLINDNTRMYSPYIIFIYA